MILVIGEYAMPEPDAVCRSEYTAIHRVLSTKLANVNPDLRVEEAIGILDEFKAWTQSVREKLEHIHQSR